LKIFDTEPVFDRIRTIESIHNEWLPSFKNHPAVADVRLLGTIAALELRAEDAGYLSQLRSRLYPFFLSHGVLLRPLANALYMVPPYVIQRTDMHQVYTAITEALS